MKSWMDPDHISPIDRCSVRLLPSKEAFKKLTSSYKLFGGKSKISLAISIQHPAFYVELINRLMGGINDRLRGRNYVF